jgi:hypothetical protein
MPTTTAVDVTITQRFTGLEHAIDNTPLFAIDFTYFERRVIRLRQGSGEIRPGPPTRHPRWGGRRDAAPVECRRTCTTGW